MGKENTILFLGIGAIAAYFLLPEKIRERVTPGGGGGITDINLSGILSGLKMPESAAPGGNIFEVIVEKAGEVIEKAKDIVPEGIVPEDIIPKDIIPKGIIPESIIPSLGPIMPEEYEYWKNLKKGIKAIGEGFSWVTGGWQEENSIINWLQKAMFKPGAELTDYAKAILAGGIERGRPGEVPARTAEFAIIKREPAAIQERAIVGERPVLRYAPRQIPGAIGTTGFRKWGKVTHGREVVGEVISKNRPESYSISEWY